MNHLPRTKISEIISKNPDINREFRKAGLDFESRHKVYDSIAIDIHEAIGCCKSTLTEGDQK